MHDRRRFALREFFFSDGVDLRSVETSLDSKFVGADEKAVGIGPQQWLVTKAWAVRMAGRTVGSVVSGINAEKIELACRIGILAYRDQQTAVFLRNPGCRVCINLEDCHQPTPCLWIEICLGIGKRVAENIRGTANDCRGAFKELIHRRRPHQQSMGPLFINGQSVIHYFKDKAVARRQTLVGRLNAKLGVLVDTGAGIPLIKMRYAIEAR